MSFRNVCGLVLVVLVSVCLETAFAGDPGSFEEGTLAAGAVNREMMKSGAVNSLEVKQIEFREKVITVEYPKGKFQKITIKVPVIQIRQEGEKFKGESLPPAKTALQLWLEQNPRTGDRTKQKTPPASSSGQL